MLGPRQIRADFDGGDISSDVGALLLRKTEELTGIIRRLAKCFDDHRNPNLIDHSVDEPVARRVYGLALGYEDLNEHDDLRPDPSLAVVVNKSERTGDTRARSLDRNKAARTRARSTDWNTRPSALARRVVTRKSSTAHDVERLFVGLFLQAHAKPPERIVLDLDDDNDPISVDNSIAPSTDSTRTTALSHCTFSVAIACFAPACDPPTSTRRPEQSSISSASSAKSPARTWPHVKITIRAACGFRREEILSWFENNRVDYIMGVAKNTRLKAMIAAEQGQVRRAFETSKQPARFFAELRYRLLDTWSRERRVPAKAEHPAKGANPRFAVASLKGAGSRGAAAYCGRGEVENRIKEQQLHLFVDRTSAGPMLANQARPYCLSIAYVIVQCLASARSDGDGIGRVAMPNNPVETAEDRRVGASDGPQGVGEVVERLAVRRDPPQGACESGRVAAVCPAMLT